MFYARKLNISGWFMHNTALSIGPYRLVRLSVPLPESTCGFLRKHVSFRGKARVLSASCTCAFAGRLLSLDTQRAEPWLPAC